MECLQGEILSLIADRNRNLIVTALDAPPAVVAAGDELYDCIPRKDVRHRWDRSATVRTLRCTGGLPSLGSGRHRIASTVVDLAA